MNANVEKKYILIVFIASTIGWLFFLKVPMHSDDTGFMLVAKSFENIQFFHYSHYTHRIGTTLPLFFLIKVFGYNLFTYYFYAYIHFISLMIAMYVFMATSFPSRTAAYVCVALAVCSNSINITASNVMSDIPAAGFFIWSLIAFISATQADSTRAKLLLVFLSAATGFAGYGCKMTTALFLLALPAYEIMASRTIRTTFFFGLVFLGFLGLEGLYDAIVFGNPFIRYAIMRSIVGNQSNLPVLHSWSEYILRVPLFMWKNYDIKILSVLAAFSIMFGAFRKNAAFISFTIGALAAFCMYAYPVFSWKPLIPATNTIVRYYFLTIVLLIFMSSYTISWVSGHVSIRNHGLGILKFIVLIGIFPSLLFADQLYTSRSKLVINGATNDYFESSGLFNDFLDANPQVLGKPVYTLPERSFSIYPGFNRLNMVDTERFPRPAAPFYMLARQRDLDFYVDMFAALEDYQTTEGFLVLSRDTPNRQVLFQHDDLAFAALEAIVSDKDLVFAWPREQPLQEQPDLRWPQDSVSATRSSQDGAVQFQSTEDGTFPGFILCPELDFVADSTFQIEFQARVAPGARLALTFVEYPESENSVNATIRFEAFDFEHGNTPEFDHVHRFREFRTATDAQRVCFGLTSVNSPQLVVEDLSLYRFRP